MRKSFGAAALVAAGLLLGTLGEARAALPDMSAASQAATASGSNADSTACLRRGRTYTVRMRNGRRVRARYVGSRIVRRNGKRYRVYRFRR